MATTPQQIGRIVRRYRAMRGMTQLDLALMMGTSKTHISEIEHGCRNLTLRTMEKLAICLQIGLDDLVADVDLSQASWNKCPGV